MYKFQNNTNEIRTAEISDNKIYFSCPGCGAETSAPVSRLHTRYRVKVTCACQHIYIVEINNRDRSRKRVNLPAHCMVLHRSNPSNILGQPISSGQKRLTIATDPNAKIIDLSCEGLGLLSKENQLLEKGDVINLLFTLDNSTKTEIKQKYEVKNITSNRIGCSIIGDNFSLGSYLVV